MSDQYGDRRAQNPHQDDIDAGFDDAEETAGPSGVPAESRDTLHDAEHSGHANDADDDDRRLGLR